MQYLLYIYNKERGKIMGIQNYLKTQDQGKEKHIPYIDIKECSSCAELSVTIQVGQEILHPSTVDHSIKTITLYGVTKDQNQLKQLTVFQLGDDLTIPRVRTSIRKGLFSKLIATSYCNLHGLWENTCEI